MSFNSNNVLDFYKASIKGKVLPNMHYVNQKGRGISNKRRPIIYNINQKGSGTSLVTPIAQDFQQAKSMIKHSNSIKRPGSHLTFSHPKKRRSVKRSPKKTISKRKVTKKTVAKKTKSNKSRRKKITKKDIFGR